MQRLHRDHGGASYPPAHRCHCIQVLGGPTGQHERDVRAEVINLDDRAGTLGGGHLVQPVNDREHLIGGERICERDHLAGCISYALREPGKTAAELTGDPVGQVGARIPGRRRNDHGHKGRGIVVSQQFASQLDDQHALARASIAQNDESARWQPAEQLRNVIELSGKTVWRHRRPLGQCCLRRAGVPPHGQWARVVDSAQALLVCPLPGQCCRQVVPGLRDVDPGDRRRSTHPAKEAADNWREQSRSAEESRRDAAEVARPGHALRPEIAAEQPGARGQKYQDHGEAEAAANARTRHVVIMAKQCVITRQQEYCVTVPTSQCRPRCLTNGRL